MGRQCVSLEPPPVLFCAEKIARFHDAVLAPGLGTLIMLVNVVLLWALC